jgi:hypothetical protein
MNNGNLTTDILNEDKNKAFLVDSILPRFSVSLFYRRQTNNQTQERLVCKIIEANNEDEAIGKAYRLTKNEFQLFDLVYELTIKIPVQNSIGSNMKNYRELRKKAGLTLRKVEEMTGISNAYLSQLETGKIKKPSFDIVQKLNSIYQNWV